LLRVEQALQANVPLLQYRNKGADLPLCAEQLAALQPLCRQYAVPLIVNDHLDLALKCEGAGLHLGGDDGDLALARGVLDSGRILGASCYQSLARAELAQQAGADYLAFGAVFASSTKPAAAAAGLDLLRQARLCFPESCLCAIGGITPSNAEEVWATGVNWLAVIGCVWSHARPDTVLQALWQARLGDAAREWF
jgi:thiamine-phosphate pyrophosphorylase